jgi:hypothetical protein
MASPSNPPYLRLRGRRDARLILLLFSLALARGSEPAGGSGNYLTQTTVPYAIGVPALAGIIGLVLSWRWYWHRHEAPAIDNHC